MKAVQSIAENGTTEEEMAMLDSLLETLRAGDSVKKTRKREAVKERPVTRTSPGAPLTFMPSPLSALSEGNLPRKPEPCPDLLSRDIEETPIIS